MGEEATARYRASAAPWLPITPGSVLVIVDLLALAGLTWSFSALKNGREGPAFLVSWHSLVVAVTVLATGYVVGLYQIERISPLREMMIKIISASASSAVALAVTVYITAGWEDNLGPLGRIVLAQSLAVFSVWELISRFLAQRWLSVRSGQAQWLFVVSPEGPSAVAVARLRAQPLFARSTVLVPDPERTPTLPLGGQATQPASDELGDGAWSEIADYLAHPWSGIVLAHDQPLPELVIDQLMRARLGGARVIDLTGLFERLNGRVPLERIHRLWFLMSDGFEIVHSRMGLRIKRLMDLSVSLMLLMVASPVALLAGLAIRLTGRGPVLFCQRRVGRRGATFMIYKFRTMRPDAEANGAQWAATHDPRVTLVGRFLRTTRIDELPQLWNVLRGDMSFIGPRPERPEFTATLEADIPFYSLRHLVKPGLTGWAQVCFPYGGSIADSREKLEYDLYYIKNHTLLLDLFILLRTIRVVIHRQGAR